MGTDKKNIYNQRVNKKRVNGEVSDRSNTLPSPLVLEIALVCRWKMQGGNVVLTVRKQTAG